MGWGDTRLTLVDTHLVLAMTKPARWTPKPRLWHCVRVQPGSGNGDVPELPLRRDRALGQLGIGSLRLANGGLDPRPIHVALGLLQWQQGDVVWPRRAGARQLSPTQHRTDRGRHVASINALAVYVSIPLFP